MSCTEFTVVRHGQTIANKTGTLQGQTDTPRGVDQTYLLDKAFVEAILTNNPSLIRSDYADALKSLKMTMAANESMESGKVIYFND